MTGKPGTTYKDLAKVWAQKEPEKAPEAPEPVPAVGRLGTAHDRRNWLRKQAGWPQPKRHSEEGTN